MAKHWNTAKAAACVATLAASWAVCTPAAAQSCEVKIGVLGPMSGGGSAQGLAEKAAVEFEAAYT
ncbi:hypothetical protein NO135_25440, partial [Clostridioides difficile]|nr:hypothetical protein [Clostridioides difficile]